MAVYTTTIQARIEQAINTAIEYDDPTVPPTPATSVVWPSQVKKIDAWIEWARQGIFDFNYPINTADKQRFECNFLRHFYTREIGFETWGQFQLKLAAELNLLIPKYNKLWDEASRYANVDLSDNANYSTVRVYAGTLTIDDVDTYNKTYGSNGTDNGSNLRKYSDTPQGTVSNVQDNSYLTNVTQNTMNNSSQRTDTDRGTIDKDGTHTDNIRETITRQGKDGGMTFAEAILKARKTYINIDNMLCDQLEPLFMGIW